MEPLISVVIPTYNSEHTISTTLKSVLDQKFKDFEVIIVDDCSSDDTVNKIKNIKKDEITNHKIKIIKLKKNYGGPAHPRNIGIEKASGRFIAFLDSDDIWHPSKLEVQVKHIRNHNLDFCCTGLIDFKNEREIEFEDIGEYSFQEISFNKLLYRNHVPASSVVVLKKLIYKVRFNTDLKVKAREDFLAWLKCHEFSSKSHKLEIPLLYYRISEDQISENKLKMIKRHHHALKNYECGDGNRLGSWAILYTFTHFFSAIYYRFFKGTL